MYAVISPDRHEVWPHAAIRLLERGDESLVERRIVIRGIHVCRHRAEHHVAHAGEQFVIQSVAGTDDLDAGLVEATLDELPDEGAALPDRNEHENGFRLQIRC